METYGNRKKRNCEENLSPSSRIKRKKRKEYEKQRKYKVKEEEIETKRRKKKAINDKEK